MGEGSSPHLCFSDAGLKDVVDDWADWASMVPLLWPSSRWTATEKRFQKDGSRIPAIVGDVIAGCLVGGFRSGMSERIAIALEGLEELFGVQREVASESQMPVNVCRRLF